MNNHGKKERFQFVLWQWSFRKKQQSLREFHIVLWFSKPLSYLLLPVGGEQWSPECGCVLASDIQAPGGETVLEPPSRQLSKMSIQPGQHHPFPGPLPWLLKRPSCWHSCLPPGHAPLRGRSDRLKTHIGSHHCSMDPSGSPYCYPSKIQTSQCGLQDPEVLCPTRLSRPLLSHCPQPHWPSFSSANVPSSLVWVDWYWPLPLVQNPPCSNIYKAAPLLQSQG